MGEDYLHGLRARDSDVFRMERHGNSDDLPIMGAHLVAVPALQARSDQAVDGSHNGTEGTEIRLSRRTRVSIVMWTPYVDMEGSDSAPEPESSSLPLESVKT